MVFQVRRISPAIFGFALFCFVLPFITLSCPGGQFTFTGVQIALGTTVKEPGMFGQEGEEKKIHGEPLALMALICVAAGLCAGLLLRGGAAKWAGVGLGILATLFLLFLKGKINNDVMKEGEGMFQVTYGAGYWLALLASGVGATFNAVLGKLFFSSEQAIEPPAPISTAQSGAEET